MDFTLFESKYARPLDRYVLLLNKSNQEREQFKKQSKYSNLNVTLFECFYINAINSMHCTNHSNLRTLS